MLPLHKINKANSCRVAEFKDIRKEWKLRKKEEDALRKQEEERHRQQAAAAHAHAQNGGDPSGPDGSSSGFAGRQLPPIGYQQNQYPSPAPPSAGLQQPPIGDYNSSYMQQHANYQPQSPYGQPNPSVYNQRRS